MRLSADKQSAVSQSRSSFCTNQAKVKISWKRSGLADLLVSQHWHALSWVGRRWEALSAIAEEEEEEGLAEHTDRISQFHRCFLTPSWGRMVCTGIYTGVGILRRGLCYQLDELMVLGGRYNLLSDLWTADLSLAA